jgi:hypothetical protein
VCDTPPGAAWTGGDYIDVWGERVVLPVLGEPKNGYFADIQVKLVADLTILDSGGDASSSVQRYIECACKVSRADIHLQQIR